MLKNKSELQTIVWDYYHEHGRHDLPWRQTSHLRPYRILVSEVMLQQTQVGRVIPKYRAFVKRWPNALRLANASLGEVLTAWQGLGYNRRAKALWQSAQAVQTLPRSQFPKGYEDLLALPGVGLYTAGALLAFAYNTPVPIIETNIRAVFLHHFFKNSQEVSDKDIMPLVELTLSQENPREWYWALMDYGSYLKESIGNPNIKSRHYTKQAQFKGSNREIRGAIIRALTEKSLTSGQLAGILSRFASHQITNQVRALENEGMLLKQQNRYRLP